MEQKNPGYWNNFLRIDLTSKTIQKESLNDDIFRQYVGGDLLGTYFLLKETLPGVDPLSKNNSLIFMTSPLTGTRISGAGRHSIIAKSPLTGGIAASQCGGYWGAELKKAGYDGIIINGKASKPCYLNIVDEKIEILSANEIWGKIAEDTDAYLKEKHNGSRNCLIGIGGENLIEYACIVSELHHFAGRGGLGAVMGSKNLKAVCVSGSASVRLSNPEGFREIVSWFNRGAKVNPALKIHHDLGTSKGVIGMSVGGMLPTRNFQDSSFEGAQKISGEAMKAEIGAGSGTCYSCVVACKRRIKKDDEAGIIGKVGGPEYESIAALGSALGIDDIKTVVKNNELCNSYGLDTISTGMTIAWATECFERGLITTEDTGGIILEWNARETVKDLIKMIAYKQGFGEVLSHGSKKAAEIIGRGTIKYAIQVKGQEFPGHEPRSKWGVALGYAVSPTGADHLEAAHDPWFDKPGDPEREWGFVDLYDLAPLGILEPVPAQSLSSQKVRMFVYLQQFWGLLDVISMCIFVTAPEFRAIDLDRVNTLIKTVTGWNTSLFELMKVGERWITLLRLYNLREGLTAGDDSLPDRCFEPIREGSTKGVKIDKEEFEKALNLYYGMMGWNEKGVPTEAKLEELNIGEFKEFIQK